MIKVKNLSFSYDNKQLFSNITINFENNFYLLEGRNGSGKSTLMKIIAGLKNPVEGLVEKSEKSIDKILFLESTGVGSSDLSIMENISLLYWMFDTKLTDSHIKKIKKTLFTEEELLEKYIKASLGMKLKVGLSLLYSDIAWGLIILDETFSGIDVESMQHIVSELQNKQCPKIIVSHQKMEHYFKNYKKIRLTKNKIE
ncbi:MAG: ATP-binding cassette domain-containing protein [Lactobacillales bacterium]|nr:ATP-binding cassette domain-containing protein [Lactobacillales bacterium]